MTGDFHVSVRAPDGRLWAIAVRGREGSKVRDWEVRNGAGQRVADGWSYRGPEYARLKAEKAYRMASGSATVEVVDVLST